MKIPKMAIISLLMLIVSASNSHAWLTAGRVLCDANQSGQIDAGDQPVLGVLVVVTNVSGTFSNATSLPHQEATSRWSCLLRRIPMSNSSTR